MLVLRRNVGEEVVVSSTDGTVIGRIMVVDAVGEKVRLGFAGFDGLNVDRKEVYHVKFPQLKEQDHAKSQEAKCGFCGSSQVPCLCAT